MTASGNASQANVSLQGAPPAAPEHAKPLQGMVLTVGLLDGSHPSHVDDVVRPLLDLIQGLTGLDAAHVTVLDWLTEEQQVLFADSARSLDPADKAASRWVEAFCQRALESTSSSAATATSVRRGRRGPRSARLVHPIESHERRAVVGVLCATGSPGQPGPAEDEARQVLADLAKILGRHLDLEHAARRRESEARAAEQRAHDRATFLAIAQHRLKTPLTVIRGWAHILRSRGETTLNDTELDEGINAIWRNANSLRGLVDELLEEASADAHTREMHVAAGDLVPGLTSLCSEFDGISMDHPVRAEVPAALEAWFDRQALHQALGYVIVNAIKYSPSGGAVVLLARPDGPQVVIEVVDEGPGIPDDLDLFAPFTRGDDSVAGAGLGLHIARMIVESMNGTIDARRNADGPGSTFSIRLRGVAVAGPLRREAAD